MFFFLRHFPHGFLELFKGILLLFVQMFRHLYNKGHIVVAPDILVPESRNTFSFQTHTGVRLGSCLNRIVIRTVYRIDLDRRAKCCLGKGDRLRGYNIVFLSLEFRMPVHGNNHEEISPSVLRLFRALLFRGF